MVGVLPLQESFVFLSPAASSEPYPLLSNSPIEGSDTGGGRESKTPPMLSDQAVDVCGRRAGL